MQKSLQKQHQIKILPALIVNEKLRLQKVDIDDVVQTVQGALSPHVDGGIDVTITLLEKNLRIIKDIALMKEALTLLVSNVMGTMPAYGKFSLAINQANFKIKSLLNGDDSIIGACAFMYLAGVSMYISDEKLKKKILEPFFITRTDDNGVRLAIAYRIIKQHHLRIKVSNPMGQGTGVNIYLPLNRLEIVSMMSIPIE